jgi:hypothetical protein
MPSLRAAGFDIANQFRARDIRSSTIFLRFQRSVMDSAVELRAGHAKNLCRFGHLKTQGRQSVSAVSNSLVRAGIVCPGSHRQCLQADFCRSALCEGKFSLLSIFHTPGRKVSPEFPGIFRQYLEKMLLRARQRRTLSKYWAGTHKYSLLLRSEGSRHRNRLNSTRYGRFLWTALAPARVRCGEGTRTADGF